MSSSEDKRNRGIAIAVLILMALLLFWVWWKMSRPSEPKSVLPPITEPLPIGRETPVAPAPLPSPLPVPSAPKPVPPATLKKPVVHKTPKRSTVTSSVSVPKVLVPYAPSNPPVSLPAPVPPPPQVREWQGKDTAIKHNGQVVIRSDHQWISFWAEHHPDEAAPDVDFSRDMVVGVFAGERPADQFSIVIDSAKEVSGTLVVNYREIPPPTGTFALNVSVYPYDIKVIPHSTLPVKFNRFIDNSGR